MNKGEFLKQLWLTLFGVMLIGAAILFIGVIRHKDNLVELNSAEYIETTIDIGDDFHNVSVSTESENITFLLSENDTCRVAFRVLENADVSASVQDDTLTVRVENPSNIDTRLGIITINEGEGSVVVYLPKDSYDSVTASSSCGEISVPENFSFENVEISTSIGDVEYCAASNGSITIDGSTSNLHLYDLTAESIDLTVSTGDVTAESITCSGDLYLSVSTGESTLADITCQNFTSDGSVGSIEMNHLLAENLISIERSIGGVHFDKCDAGELFVTTSTGDVTGSLLSDKVFITDSSTGDIHTPETITGGKCKISTSTGNIDMTIE